MRDLDIGSGGAALFVVGVFWSLVGFSLSWDPALVAGGVVASIGIVLIGFAPSDGSEMALDADELED